MTIRNRYVLRHIARPLIAAMSIGLAILLAERMVRLLDITLGKKSSFGVVFEMLAYLVPHYLGLAMPAGFFLGLIFGFSRLSRDSEVNAFLAGGVGLHQLTVPVLVLGIVFSSLSAVMLGYIQPHTRYAFRALVHAVRNVQIFYLAEEGVFMRTANHTFILDKLSRSDNRFRGVFIYVTPPEGNFETITAKGGELITVEDDPRPVLRLERGQRLTIQGRPGFDRSKPLPRQSSEAFSQIDTPIGTVEETIFRPRGRDRRELTMPELIAARSKPWPGIGGNAIVSEMHRRIVEILSVLLLPILAVPFAVQRGRRPRPYAYGVAFVIIVIYHELLQQGALWVRLHGLSPLIGLYLPFGALALFALWRYYNRCFLLRGDSLDRLYDGLSSAFGRLRRRIAGREGAA